MSGYDDIAQQLKQGQPESSPYDAVAMAMKQDEVNLHSQASMAVGLSADQNADRAAQNAMLAKRYNTIPEVVDKYPDEFRQRMTMEMTREALKNAPVLQSHIASNPGIAPIIHDDVQNTANIEQSLTEWKPSLGEKIAEWRRNLFGIDDKERARAMNTLAEREAGLSAGQARTAVGGMSEIPEQFAGKMVNTGTLGILPDVSGTAQTPAGGIAGGAGSLAGFFTGPLGLTNRLLTPLKGELGLTQYAGDSFVKGLAKGIADQSLTLGTASGLTELGNLIDSPDVQSAINKEAQAFLGGAGTGAVFGAAGRILPDATIAQTIGRFAAITAGLDVAAGKKPFEDIPNFENMTPEEKGGVIFNYGLNAFFSLAGAGRTQGGWIHDAARADLAQQDFAKFSKLNDAASQSKWRERDNKNGTAGFKNFVRDAGQGIESVYVDAASLNNALLQSGTPREEVARTMPEVAKSLDEATATGGDVRIPVEDYLSHIAGTELDKTLLQHVKTDPAGMTKAEADTFIANQGELLKEQAIKQATESSDRKEWEQSHKLVQDDIQNQLDQAGRFSPEVNKVYAAVQSNIVSRIAASEGIKPKEAWDKYGASIVAREVAGSQFNQAAYHGSPYKFDKFSLEHMGKGEGAQAYGWGLYFAGNKEVAEWYRENLAPQELYLNGKKAVTVKEKFTNAQRTRIWDALKKDADIKALLDESSNYYGDINSVLDMYVRYAGDFSKVRDFYSDVSDYFKPKYEKILSALEGKLESKSKGQLYHVDIPDDDTMLHWDKPLSEQPKKVREALETAFHAVKDQYPSMSDDPTGEVVYRAVAGNVGTSSQEAASKYLHSLGINGIKYLDGTSRSKGEGHHNYVIFDDNAVKILNTYYQNQGAPKGAYSISDRTLALLKGADYSTFVHETGHWALETYATIANHPDAPENIKSDMGKILEWFGVKDLETWNKMSLEEKRPHHEKLAEGFEQYFMEGKAPSVELRPVFARLKAWMISVYQTLKGLNVELTDEVRGVFDRMLASEDAIKESEQARGYEALFKTPEEAAKLGMTAEEFKAYQDASVNATGKALEELQARSLRDMKWFSNAKSKAMNELQKQANGRRSVVREEVEAQVNEMPVYKLAAEDKSVGMDILADRYGYASAEAAQKALDEMRPKKEVINEITDQRMLERYGDLNSPKAIERAAEEAIHNDMRAKVLATEFAALSKIKGSERMIVIAARQAAQEAISQKKMADVRPAQYEAAEARAGKAADKAMAKGNIEEAAAKKREQILNNQMAKAAQDAINDSMKLLAYGKRLERKAAQGNMRGEALLQLNALLGRFDLRKQPGNLDNNRKPIAQWIEQEAEKLSAVMPDLPEWVLNEGYRTSYKEMTVAQIREFRDTLKQLEFLAKRENSQYVAIRNMSFAQERSEVLDEIRKFWPDAFDEEGNPKGMEPDFVPTIKKAAGKMGDKFAGEFLSSETILSLLGGGKFSTVNESLFGRMSRQADWKAKRMEAVYAELKPAFDQYSIKEKYDFARKDIATPAGIDTPLTRENALVTALLYGNKEGRERLTNYGWSDAKQRSIINLLDERDLKLANTIWKLFDESLWPELKDLNDRTRGKAPPKVEAIPFDAKGGKARGGYFRLKYDTALDERAHRLDEGQAVKELLGGGMGMSSKTNQGSSTERIKGVKLRPRLDLGVFSEAVNETVHDLAYREAVADTMRMLNDKGIMDATKQIVGNEGYHALLTRVREVAAPPRNPSGFVEKTLSIARRNTVINLMSGVKTALQNFTGIFPALSEVNSGYVLKELAQFYSPKMMERYEFTMSQSEFMRHRFTSYDRDLQAMAGKLTVKGSIRPDASTFLALMGFVDKGVSVPVWNAAFKQGMDKFANDHQKAVDYADYVVRQTQGSGREVDLPQIMSGHGGYGQLKRVFTMFYSYFNGQLNLLVKHGVISKIEARDNPAQATANFTARFIAIVAMPAILTEMLMNGMDNDESPEELMIRYAGAFVRYGAGFFPLVRDIVPAIWVKATGQGHYYGVKVSPIDSAFEGIVKGSESAGNVAKGEGTAKDTKNLIMATGYGLGIPGKLVADTVDGTRAYMNDEAGPQAIVLGPPKK